MSGFAVLISESAQREFGGMDAPTKSRLRRAFSQMAADPYRPRSGADIKKLRAFAEPDLYRLRVGEWRIIYSVIGKEVKITSLMRRGKGYGWLE